MEASNGIKLKKSSWHYRLIQYVGLRPVPTNICLYFWTVVASFAVIGVGALVIATLVGFVALMVGYIAYTYYFVSSDLFSALTLAAMILIIGSTAFRIAHHLQKDGVTEFKEYHLFKKQNKKPAEPSEPQPPSLLSLKLKAVKDKVCSDLEFVD